jgi:hypothetical protein
MAGFATTIKLGKIGKEIQLPITDPEDMISGFRARLGNNQAETENVLKETFTVLHRRWSSEYQIRFGELKESLAHALVSLNALRAQHIAFIFANAWPRYSEEYVTEDGLGITLKTSPALLLDKAYNAAALAATMRITAVYDNYDAKGAQVGGAVAGTYNRATGVFTFTVPRTPGTSVFVNWEHDGELVKIRTGFEMDYSGAFDGAGVPRWNVSATLKGV